MRKHRLIPILSLVLILLLPLGCSQPPAQPLVPAANKFDGQRALEHAQELASPIYTGRLPGTEGNILASQYIASKFEEYGLKPMGEDKTYFQWYQQKSVSYPEPFTLEVLKQDGSLEKSLQYRYDFIETNSGEKYGVDLAADATRCKIDAKAQSILLTGLDGSTAEIVGRAPVSGYGNNRAAMYIRSGRITFQRHPTLIVTPEVFESLTKDLNNGHTLKLKGAIDYPLVTVPNVVAHLPSSDKAKASVMITAHFDHFGTDFTGEINSGAVDNAAGVSVMLELARYLSLQNMPIDFTFVAFNGEEYGLLGAEHYVQTTRPQSGTIIINIDTVGLSNLDYTFLLYDGSGTALTSQLKEIYQRYGQEVVIGPSPRADHAPFGRRGFNAVSIVQFSQHYFDNLYHTPNDTIDLVSADSLKQVGEFVLDFLTEKLPK